MLLFFFCSVVFSKVDLEAYVQPFFSLDLQGSLGDSGQASFGFHRIKTDAKFQKEFENLSIKGRVSLDFAEKTLDKSVKNAFIEMKINKLFNFKMGQFKSAFGMESATSSKKLDPIYRGAISRYIRNDCGVGGYLLGGGVYGRFAEKFNYSLILYDNDGFSKTGGSKKDYLKRLFGVPVGSLKYRHNKSLSLYCSFALPFYGAVVLGSETVGKRYLFSDLAVTVDVRKYSGAVELFIGRDTIDTKEYLYSTSKAYDGLSQAISFSNSYELPIKGELSSIFWGRFEYLNGLAYDGLMYQDRSFYYTLAGGLKLLYNDDFSINLGVDEKYDVGFKKINKLRLTLECTALFGTTIGKKEYEFEN